MHADTGHRCPFPATLPKGYSRQMVGPEVPQAEELLRGTPYLIADGSEARTRFVRVMTRAAGIGPRAILAAESIAEKARDVLPQFELAVRSDLVAESNRMEGIESSPREIKDLARVKSELLHMEIHGFVEFVRDDPRVLESLGLLRAYEVADEWASEQARPREFELRQLHTLVMPGLESAGKYKIAPNKIGKSKHLPTDPGSTGAAMAELAKWFADGTGDAVLDAAVVHAWLTHIHPFDDGNGRMARLLANLALIQARYPPLLLRSGSDRGQYLDALAASDAGDLLPLYDVFAKSLRRVVLTMEKPNYVDAKIRGEFLATTAQRRKAWQASAATFFTCLEQKARRTEWSVRDMGYPGLDDFELLERRDSAGNCWFAKFRHNGVDEWLLWFGYRSDEMIELVGERRPWPSVFFAQLTGEPTSVHPFVTRWNPNDRHRRPAEICLSPGSRRPVSLRWDYEVEELRIDEAAGAVIRALCR